MEISYSNDQACPAACVTKKSLECLCEDLSIFAPGSQLTNIFSKSNIQKLTQLGSFADWKFYSSIGFWSVTLLTICFCVSLWVIKKKIPDYCIMTNYSKMENPTKLRFFATSFAVVHPLLNVYMLKKHPNPKIMRAMIFYTRTFLIFAFVAIFS